METYYTVLAGIAGLVTGSFTNVCIYSIPKGEDFVKRRSHCMNCGAELKWYDLIPVISFLFLKGKCRYCKKKISVQYPLVELLTCVAYLIIFMVKGPSLSACLYCGFTSALIVLSVIDARTREIPIAVNLFIALIGIMVTCIDRTNWTSHAMGALAISIPLLFLYLITKGNGIGGGDIKLALAAGIVLGWKLVVTGFILGCILGTVIHPVIMVLKKADHTLAFGPYMAAGFFVALLYGNQLVYLIYGF